MPVSVEAQGYRDLDRGSLLNGIPKKTTSSGTCLAATMAPSALTLRPQKRAYYNIPGFSACIRRLLAVSSVFPESLAFWAGVCEMAGSDFFTPKCCDRMMHLDGLAPQV